MCNGANLAFERPAFDAVNGYSGTDGLASGDDVFLMLKMKRKWRSSVHFVQDKRAIVYTEALESVGAFFQQRKRWASKSRAYRDVGVILVATIVLVMNLSILTALITSVFAPSLLSFAIALIVFKGVVDFFFLHLVASFFGRKSLLLLLLPEQVLYIFYVGIFGIVGWLGGYRWKGRTRT